MTRSLAIFRARSVLMLGLLAACSQAPQQVSVTGPATQVRAVETTGRTGLRVLGLTQGSVRACSGSYTPPTLTSPTRSTELSCTGGVAGVATVGPDITGSRAVRWELETGESGHVRL